MAHIATSHVTHEKYVTHMHESCHTYEWGSRVTHMHESCHTYEWVMSHIRMSHATHMNESWHRHKCDTSHIQLNHATQSSFYRKEYISTRLWKQYIKRLSYRTRRLRKEHIYIFFKNISICSLKKTEEYINMFYKYVL